MTIQVINVGSGANAGNGDSIRSAFIKVNNNFTELVVAVNTATQGPQGNTGRGYLGITSQTTATLGTGSVTFATSDTGAYIIGSYVRVLSQSSNTNYLQGTITNLNTDQDITVNVDNFSGFGTKNDWIFSVIGPIGLSGPSGPTGPSGGPSGPTGPGFSDIESFTTQTISLSTFTFAVANSGAFEVGNYVKVKAASDYSSYFTGYITNLIRNESITVEADALGNGGTYTHWLFMLTGPAGPAGSIGFLNDVTDVSIASPLINNYLKWNGSFWINANLSISDDTTPSLSSNLDVRNNRIYSSTSNTVFINELNLTLGNTSTKITVTENPYTLQFYINDGTGQSSLSAELRNTSSFRVNKISTLSGSAISFGTDLEPFSNNEYSLGSISNRWKNLNIASGITIGSSTLTVTSGQLRLDGVAVTSTVIVNFNDLTDVELNSPTNNQILRYLNGTWTNVSETSATVYTLSAETTSTGVLISLAGSDNSKNRIKILEGPNTSISLVDTGTVIISSISTSTPVSFSTFNITGNMANTFYEFAADSRFFPTQASNPILYLRRGETYYFILNTPGNPFQIKDSNGGAQYNVGVTNNGIDVGTLTFTVPMVAPNNLYYQSTFYSSMGAVINIV